MKIQQKVASYEIICMWETGLISQANESKVVYLLAYPIAGPFKDRFLLVCSTLRNLTKLFK